MKKALLLITSFIFSFSCSDEVISEDFELNNETVFKINQEYHSASDELMIKITDIQDSRCPSDAVCVWEGEARITVKIFQPDDFTSVLSTYDNRTDTVGNYSVELIDVQPYPATDEAIEKDEYNVTMKITAIASGN